MTTLIFDADGVLYDSVERMFDVTNRTLSEFELGPITFETFRNAYNPKNWHTTFKIYGLKEEEYEKYQNRYKENELTLTKPRLIPPKNLFGFLKRKGYTLHILTSAKSEDIENKLKIDNIRTSFDKVISVPNGCKSPELIKLLRTNHQPYYPPPYYFIGDSTSDAEAVIEARKEIQISFLGIVHKIVHPSFRRDRHMSTESEFNKIIQPERGDRLIKKLTELAKLEK